MINEQQTLAVRYRPQTFSEVCSQKTVIEILTKQLETNTFKHCYLFTGSAGTGKTSIGKIFAREINKGKGNPIEIDAASNNSVDNIRQIIKQAQSQSIDSEYKVFILDEVHMLSTGAFNAMLKLIEEPPAKSIFIMCTTDPQKIPPTILSRVQRYDLTRIADSVIIDRLKYICEKENIKIDEQALKFISLKADGGMRDAITYLDKAQSYNKDLTLNNVIEALGMIQYDIMNSFINAIITKNDKEIITIIDDLYIKGYDLKSFIYQLINFCIEITKRIINCDNNLPVDLKTSDNLDIIKSIINKLIKLNSDIKYMNNCHYYIEAFLLGDN